MYQSQGVTVALLSRTQQIDSHSDTIDSHTNIEESKTIQCITVTPPVKNVLEATTWLATDTTSGPRVNRNHCLGSFTIIREVIQTCFVAPSLLFSLLSPFLLRFVTNLLFFLPASQ